jgi:hypothetical protein
MADENRMAEAGAKLAEAAAAQGGGQPALGSSAVPAEDAAPGAPVDAGADPLGGLDAAAAPLPTLAAAPAAAPPTTPRWRRRWLALASSRGLDRVIIACICVNMAAARSARAGRLAACSPDASRA